MKLMKSSYKEIIKDYHSAVFLNSNLPNVRTYLRPCTVSFTFT